MIDLHSHVIPDVDDGPISIKESLQLLETAARDGIDTIIATPHYNGYYADERDGILLRLDRLKQAAIEHGLQVSLLPGQEIQIHDTLLENYRSGKLLTLANSRYMLIELPAEGIPYYAERLFYELEMLGVKPIIAHPERNADFLESPDKLYRLIQKGALAQLTSSSLFGFFGKRVQTFSHELIQADLVHFIATDAHNTDRRSFDLKEAYEAISLKYGPEQINYFKNNARIVIEDETIYPRDAKQIVRNKIFGIF